jgi:hypothetical protein
VTSKEGLIVRTTLIVAVMLCAGCGGGPRRAAPVDVERARETVKAALDAWKAGAKPAEMPGRSPSITVQDFDWMAGGKLLEYRLLDEGKAEDANLRIQARLTVQDAKGKSAQKTVAYIVGTDPVLTVFRAFE